MKILSSFLFALLFIVASCSTTERAQRHYEQSGRYLDINELEKARAELREAIRHDPDFAEAYARLGEVNYHTRNFEEAGVQLHRAYELWDDPPGRLVYLIAKNELELENFQTALEWQNKYLAHPGATPRAREEIGQLKIATEQALETIRIGRKFEPVNLGAEVNSPNHEYHPMLTADEVTLLFTRRFPDNREQFFISGKFEDDWNEAIAFEINDEDARQGTVTIAPDGKTIYFAADYGSATRSRQQNFDIYYSEFDGEKWRTPVNIGEPINTSHYESQPSISADGRSLYFVSRRPGGHGGVDIWVSHLQTDCTWGEPENLGPKINTPGDEQVPFIHADNQTLYFGSNGHGGLGGSDLFVSRRLPDGSWGLPKNIGYPVNTPGNEGTLFVSVDGEKAYFASDRLGGFGGLDIYYFEPWDEIKPQPVTYVTATVRDFKTRQPLDVDFELLDLESGEVILSSRCNQYLKDNFLIVLPARKDYALNVSRPGYLFHSEHFSLPESRNYDPQHLEIYLKEIEPGGTFVLRNVFFDTDKYDLRDESRTELERLVSFLNNYPKVTIEISGHTDNVGTATYNQQLSERRARAVYEFLISHEIPAGRLSYKGYGEEQPVASNETEEGRAQNRRTEVRILSVE